jgi:hypothetical protein
VVEVVRTLGEVGAEDQLEQAVAELVGMVLIEDRVVDADDGVGLP